MMPRIKRSVFVLLLTAVVAAGGAVVGSAAVSATPASTDIRSSTVPCGYPPGSCLVFFNKSGYTHRQHVHFKTTVHSFDARGKVLIRIAGPHGYHHRFHLRANTRGTVAGLFKITKHLRIGKYTMTLRGHKHGRRQIISGYFRVKR